MAIGGMVDPASLLAMFAQLTAAGSAGDGGNGWAHDGQRLGVAPPPWEAAGTTERCPGGVGATRWVAGEPRGVVGLRVGGGGDTRRG